MDTPKINRLMTTQVITVSPDCIVKQAVSMMKQHKISFLVVAEQGKPVGVLSERDVVRLACEHQDPNRLLMQDVMTSPVITMHEHCNLFEVYDVLNSKKIRHLVVVDTDGHIAGLVTLTNILGGMSIEYFVELKQVSNIMSQNICTLSTDDSAQSAVRLMREKRISCVVVTSDNKPIGIITERDITRLYADGGLEHASVANIMTAPVRTMSADIFIPQANEVMRVEKLRHMVIVHPNGELAGLISQSDIARRIEEHYVGYLRTMIKQQDRKLQYEHGRFSILFEQNPNAVVSMDMAGQIIDVNQAFMRLSGYTEDMVIGRQMISLIHSSDVDKASQCFAKACERENGMGEFQLLHKSGRTSHVFTTYLPIYADHTLHRIYAVMHDVTEARQASQQVHIAEEKAQLLSQAVNQAVDAVIITNRQGVIEFVNEAFTQITGYSPEEAIGNTPGMLKSGEQDADFYKQMWATITSGEKWQSRLVDRRKNGEFYPAELSIAPVRNGAGEISHFVAIKRDLTEREILEKQFHQAQKMEAIGTLVGGIAHDFNNILAGITGNLYLAKIKVKENPDAVEKLERVEKLSVRAASMINQLLTFARKGVVSKKEIPLGPFIKETLKFLQTTIPENITVTVDVCPDMLCVLADDAQLHQVLMNLINNARDAIEGVKQPEISIKLESFCPNRDFLARYTYFTNGTFAHLSVADNGCGISEQQLHNVFEPFFTTKENGKGTGLGLSMVYGAVKTHHGFVEVDSIEAKGSTFHIYLPSLQVQHDPVASIAHHAPLKGLGEMILLVDDEKHVRETTAEVLESLNYNVLQAENGQQAVELFTKHQQRIAIVLLDVVMPVLGGFEAASRIRQSNADVPVLFITGYDRKHVLVANGKDASLSNCRVLDKPVRCDVLSQNIRLLLGDN